MDKSQKFNKIFGNINNSVKFREIQKHTKNIFSKIFTNSFDFYYSGF